MSRRGDFFHGTRAPGLDVGDKLLPHNVLGVEPNYEHFEAHSRNHVFMADEEEQAWAWSTGGRNHPDERTAVLRVKPGPSLREGAGENTARSARVLERYDIKPGRQGTLPINWRQFGREDGEGTGYDALNHPTDEAVEFGHAEGARVFKERLYPPDAFSLNLKARREREAKDAEREAISRGQGRLF